MLVVRLGATLLALAFVLPASASARPVDEPCEYDRYEICDASRPAPEIMVAPSSPRAGGPAQLLAYSPGRGIVLAWDLDADGAYDDAAGPVVETTFAAGQRRVRVRATDEDGRVGTNEIVLDVHARNEPPTGELAFAPARVGREIEVAGWGADPDGEVRKLELDADGDGAYELDAAGEEIARRVSFPTAGERTLRLRVTDDAGARTVTTASVEVHAHDLPPRVAVVVPGSARVGRPVLVTGRASDRDGTIEATAFDLDGNGTYETDGGGEEEATVTFATPGARVVGMKVTDDGGGTAVSRASIEVTAANEAPTVELRHEGLRGLVATAADDGAIDDYAWDLDGDGAYDDDAGPWATTVLPLAFTGQVEAGVRVTDDEGATAAARLVVRLPQDELLPPVVNSWPSQPRAGEVVSFQLGLTEGLTSVEFDSGDGIFKPGESLAKTFAQPGTYSVRVRVRDAKGRSAIARHAVTVSPAAGNLAPNATIVGFSTARTGAPVSLQSNFSDGDGSVAAYAWDTDADGAFDDGTQPAVAATFAAPGAHDVALRVTDDGGAVAIQYKTITVHSNNRPPQVGVSLPGPVGVSRVVALGSSAGLLPVAEGGDDPVVAWAWDTDGDGAFDDGAEVPKPIVFDQPGLRRIRVRGTDAGGLTGIGTLVVDVRAPAANRAPSVVLNVPVGTPAGTPATLVASARDADGDAVGYAWDADGDGAFDDGASASITFPYAAPGVYDASVKVTDGRGAERVVLRSVTVEPAEAGRAPVIGGFVLLSLPRVGRPTRFYAGSDAALSFDLDGDGAFDDVPGGEAEFRTWTFTSPDPITIAARATDAAGRTALRTLEVEPRADNVAPTVTIGAEALVAGQTAELYALAEDIDSDEGTIAWDLDGDGAYDDGDGVFATLTVAAPGAYTVGVRVTDPQGATATVSRTLVAGTRPPRPAFTVSDRAPRPGQLVTFSSTATDPEGGSIASTAWDLDDDGAFDDASGTSVTVAAPAAGPWLVGLKVRDSGGDSAITYAPLTVAGEPVTPIATVSPEPTPESTPPPPPPAPPTVEPDTFAPLVRASVRAPRLAALKRSGLLVTVTASEAAAVRVVASLDRASAKRLRLGTELAKGTVTLTQAGRATVRLKLSAKARKALRKTVRIKLDVLAVDAAGNRATASQTMTVRR